MDNQFVKDQDFWPDVDTGDLYQGVLDRFEFHRSVAEDAARRSFRLGWWLTLLIPIGATLLTLLVGFAESLPKYFIPACGFLLTVMAIVNSTLRPSEKFPGLSERLMALHNWKLDFDIRIRQLDAAEKDRIYTMLREKNAELSILGNEVAQRAIPRLVPGVRKFEREDVVTESQILK